MTTHYEALNLTPGMRSSQRFSWSGSFEGVAFAIVIYSRADLPGYPGPYDPDAVKIGSWSWDLLDARGVSVIRGVGLVRGIDMLWPYHCYEGVPPGKLLLWTQSGDDPTLADFVDNKVEVLYQAWTPPLTREQQFAALRYA